MERRVAHPGFWRILWVEDADSGPQVVYVHRQGDDVGLLAGRGT